MRRSSSGGFLSLQGDGGWRHQRRWGRDVEEGEVLDVLSGLVDKSLVVARERQESGVRYRMLEPIRQYALERLEERGEGEEARRRHATFFLALAEEAEANLRGQRTWSGLKVLKESTTT